MIKYAVKMENLKAFIFKSAILASPTKSLSPMVRSLVERRLLEFFPDFHNPDHPPYAAGGIEDGEDPKSAAIRELREETGIVSAEIVDEVPQWLTYDFPPAVKAKVNRLWGGGEWHGQAQKWFLMRLTNDESEINLANGEVEPEFSEWKWARPEEVIEQAVDYKRPTYEEVMRTFAPYLNDNGKATKCQSTKW